MSQFGKHRVIEIVDSQAVKKNGAKYKLKKTEKVPMDENFYSFTKALQKTWSGSQLTKFS